MLAILQRRLTLRNPPGDMIVRGPDRPLALPQSREEAAPAGGASAGGASDVSQLKAPWDGFLASLEPRRVAATLRDFPVERGVFPSHGTRENPGTRKGSGGERGRAGAHGKDFDSDDGEDIEVAEEAKERWLKSESRADHEDAGGTGASRDVSHCASVYDPAFVLPLLEVALGSARASLLQGRMI